jgi:hypothetical protein
LRSKWVPDAWTIELETGLDPVVVGVVDVDTGTETGAVTAGYETGGSVEAGGLVVGATRFVAGVVGGVANTCADLEGASVKCADDVWPVALVAANPEEATPNATTSATRMVLTVRTVGTPCRSFSEE